MNAFKAGFINSQCCNHFPFTQLTQCHRLQTVDVQDRNWSCIPCSGAASRVVPPPYVSTPPRTGGLPATRAFTARAGSSPAQRAPRDVRWPKFVGTGTERNAFPFKKDLSLSSFFSFFLFPKTGLSTLSNLSLD